MQILNGAPIANSVLVKLEAFSSIISENSLITGGHFILKNNKPELNLGTIESFRRAVHLYKLSKSRKMKVGLGLLVNDIGMTCDTNICYVVDSFSRDDFQLPELYKEILEQERVSVSEVDMYWEKHLRNKGMLFFRRKMVKQDKAVQKIDNAHWLVTKAGERLLLTRPSPASPNGIAACPLIMGANALEQEKRGWSKSINFWYVDIDNYENIPNHFMIEKGLEVAKHMKATIDVQNIYFTHDKVFANF